MCYYESHILHNTEYPHWSALMRSEQLASISLVLGATPHVATNVKTPVNSMKQARIQS